MKKSFLVLSVLMVFIGVSTVALASQKDVEEKTIKSDNENVADEETEHSQESEIKYQEIPIEGWSESKYTRVQNNFGDMPTIESIQKEIIQMTSQKIESKQVRELLGGDAPIFPFTPNYPTGLGPFDLPNEYAALTDDNLAYLKIAVENLELDKEVNELYQVFLDEWINEDFSNLIEVHKDLLQEYATAPEEIKGYLEVDDYRLATDQEEKIFLEHYELTSQ